MEKQLPENIRLRLEAALERYPGWRGVDRRQPAPAPVRLLGDQSNNVSVLAANDRYYVLRVYRAGADANRLDRDAERTAMERAAKARLSPKVRFFDDDLGVSVCDYLAPDPEPGPAVTELADLLSGIHALEPVTHMLYLPDRIRHYEQVLTDRDSPHASALLRDSATALESVHRLHALDPDAVLCHNDLLPANCLFSGERLWAIDWEYAASGSRWFDLAVASVGHSLGANQETALLERYLGRSPGDHERMLMALAKNGYRYLERLWYACQPGVSKT